MSRSASCRAIPRLSAFTEKLISEAGVAVIPLSPFYREPPRDSRIVRLCIAKRDDTLLEAARRIRAYTSGATPEPRPT